MRFSMNKKPENQSTVHTSASLPSNTSDLMKTVIQGADISILEAQRNSMLDLRGCFETML
jgi:hypothetical protein